MNVSFAEWFERGRRFITGGLWSADRSAGRFTAAVIRLLQLCVMIGEGFVRDQLLLRAAGLTYMTALSVVPLFVVSFSIVRAIGVSENLVDVAADALTAGIPQAKQYLVSLVRDADLRSLGTLGAGILLVTTILALRQIEETFNEIWGVRHSRSWIRRFTDYLAVIIVAPIFAAMAISLATTLQSEPLIHRLLEYNYFHALYDLGLQQTPKLMLVIGFTFLYWFFPNTRVKLWAGGVGGLVAALLFLAAQDLYVQFNVGMARANALFGVFYLIPLFLAWNYLSWAIVLLGAEVSFALQNLSHYRREIRGELAGPAEREAAGLQIAVEIGRAFRDSAPPPTSDELAESLGLSVRIVRHMLHVLEGAGIVCPVAQEDREGAYLLGRPAEKVLVIEVLWALRGPRQAPSEAHQSSTSVLVSQLLDDLEASAEEGAGGRTLFDVLEQVGPVGPEDTAATSEPHDVPKLEHRNGVVPVE